MDTNLNKNKVLVTGGAGYIGSHVVKKLLEFGYYPIILDNLSSGHKWAVLGGELVVGDLSDESLIKNLFENHNFSSVLHFASSIIVSESVQDPIKYYRNNLANTITLIDACVKHGVKNFIFSSSAAVYGIPQRIPVPETALIRPINPYGYTKAISEKVLADTASSTALRYVSLRYFNAAGADPQACIGELHKPETHLIPLALRNAMGKNSDFVIYGDDYPTGDGTCIRDYVHVEDLAQAHIDALSYLEKNGRSLELNCGYGHGYTVMQILNTIKEIVGTNDIPTKIKERRKGDPAKLVADGTRIKNILGWTPKYDDIKLIITHAFAWEKYLADSPDLI